MSENLFPDPNLPRLERRYRWRDTRGTRAGYSLGIGLALAFMAYGLYFGISHGILFTPLVLFYLAALSLMLYSALAGLLNITTVRMYADRLEVRNAPLPWPGNRSLATGQITSVIVQNNKVSGRPHFNLVLSMSDGGFVVLLNDFINPAPVSVLAGDLRLLLGLK